MISVEMISVGTILFGCNYLLSFFIEILYRNKTQKYMSFGITALFIVHQG